MPQCAAEVFSVTHSPKTDFWPSFRNNHRCRFEAQLMARDYCVVGVQGAGKYVRVGRKASDMRNITQ
jgi:hypothetical protein